MDRENTFTCEYPKDFKTLAYGSINGLEFEIDMLFTKGWHQTRFVIPKRALPEFAKFVNELNEQSFK